jgi:hypothetical protein
VRTVRFRQLVGGWPWGWGAQRIAPADRPCSRCRKHPAEKGASLHLYRDGRIALCTPCARRTCERAFGRPLTADEAEAVTYARASCVVAMPDELALLFT